MVDRSELMTQTKGKQAMSAAPKLEIEFNALVKEPAVLDVEYVDGKTRSIKASGLTYSDLSRELFQDCRAIMLSDAEQGVVREGNPFTYEEGRA